MAGSIWPSAWTISPGLRWPDLTAARGRLPASSLHESLPRAGSLAVLAAGRGDPVDLPAAAADAVMDAAGRGHELVVLDVGRSLDAVGHAALDRADELLLLVPTRLRAVVAARQIVAALGPRGSRLAVVARRRPDERWTGRRVADALGLPLAAVLADDARTDTDLARGVLPGARLRSPARRAAEQCLSGALRLAAGPRWCGGRVSAPASQDLDSALLARMREGLAGVAQVTPRAVAEAAREVGVVLGHEGLLDAVDRLRADLHGAGPLQPLLADPDVTDVLVNGPGSVWVDRGRGVQRVRVDVGDERDVRALAARLAGAAGRRLDDASPFVDAQLADGVRLHVVLPPLVAGGTHVSLRVPSRRELDLGDLVRLGTVPPAWAQVLEHLMSGLAAFVVTGGTGAGKTTVLGALLGAGARRATASSSSRTAPRCASSHPHVVRLEARPRQRRGRAARSP